MFGLFKRYQVAYLLGIPLYLDLTLLVGLGFFPMSLSTLFEGALRAKLLLGLLTYFGLLISVTLHELGHCMAARSCGIPTESITLGFFGGVAQLERLGDRPRDYLWVASAGPLVSLLIVLCCSVVVPFTSGAMHAYLQAIQLLNTGLLILNLLPGFPLDGGRIVAGICWMISMRFGQSRIVGYCQSVIAAANVSFFVFPALIGFLAVQHALTPFHVLLAWILLSASNAEKKDAQSMLAMSQVTIGEAALGIKQTGPDQRARQAFEPLPPDNKPIWAVWTEQDGVVTWYQKPGIPYPPVLSEVTMTAWDNDSLYVRDIPESVPAGFIQATASLVEFISAARSTEEKGIWIIVQGNEWVGAIRPEIVHEVLAELLGKK